jgi:hypothetical protein
MSANWRSLVKRLWSCNRVLSFKLIDLTKLGVRGGRAVNGASDVSDSQACNQCLCGVWVRSQLAALDMLHRMKGIFWRGSRTGGFLRVLRFPPPSKGSYSPNVLSRRDTVAAVLSLGRVARISQGNLWRKCYKIQKYKNTKNPLDLLPLVKSINLKEGTRLQLQRHFFYQTAPICSCANLQKFTLPRRPSDTDATALQEWF